jgi:pimeloyl-ACP methyl ester carboxylesterase
MRLSATPAGASASPGTRPVPVFFLPGGPGLAATRYAALAEALLGAGRSAYEVFLVDQRGTGASAPARCDVSFDGRSRYPPAAVKRCREALGNRNLAELGTDTAAADIERVRRAVGVDHIALYGMSYGGRVALEYARRYPDHARALVLHSPATFRNWAAEVPTATARAFDVAAARCASDPRCTRQSTDLAASMALALSQLRSAPVRLTWRGTVLSSVVSETAVTDRGLAHVVRELLYAPESYGAVAEMLAEVARGETTLLRQQAGQLIIDVRAQSVPVLLSVTCAEDLPPLTRRELRARSADTWTEALVHDLLVACEAFGLDPRPMNGRAIPDAVPILAFTGAFDPVTPPSYLSDIRSTRARQFTVADAGHGGVWPCMIPVVAAFLRLPEPSRVRAPGCAREEHASQ